MALCEEHSRKMMALLGACLRELVDAEPRTAVRVIVRAMLDAHAVDPELHHVIMEHLPKERQLPQILAVNEQAEALVKLFLLGHVDKLATQNIDMAAFIVVNTVEALTHASVIERPDLLGTEELVDEVTRLIANYLLK